MGSYFFVRFYLQADVKKSGNAETSGKNPDSTADLRPLFIAKLQQLVKQGSKGLYDLSIDSMDVDLLRSVVVLMNVKMVPDKNIWAALDSSRQAPDDVFKMSFDKLTIKGINLDDILTRKTMDFREIEITGPIIESFHEKKSYNQTKTVDSITLFQRLTNEMEKIAIGKLIIRNGNFISHSSARKKAMRLKDIEMRFADILIDSSTQYAKDRFLFAKHVMLSMQNYVVNTTDDLYECKIGSLMIQAPQQTMTITNLSLASRYNRALFQKKLVHQKEMYDCRVPSITIQGIDWYGLMNEQQFVANNINVSDPVVKIFLDRSLPMQPSRTGNFPNQLLMKLPLKISVSKMNVRNADVTYEEFNPKSEQSGSLNMDKVNLAITGVTNMPHEIKKIKQTIVKGTGRFVKQIPVKSEFVFDLVQHKRGKFSASLTTGASFQGSIMNGIALPLGLLKIEKGTVSKFNVKMNGDETNASGDVLMLYNDFKISVYEKDEGKKELDKKGLVGFFANTFVIKDDNPKKGEAPRHPQAGFQRDPQKGFFNLVWKTALTGVLETVGANPKLAEKK